MEELNPGRVVKMVDVPGGFLRGAGTGATRLGQKIHISHLCAPSISQFLMQDYSTLLERTEPLKEVAYFCTSEKISFVK